MKYHPNPEKNKQTRLKSKLTKCKNLLGIRLEKLNIMSGFNPQQQRMRMMYSNQQQQQQQYGQMNRMPMSQMGPNQGMPVQPPQGIHRPMGMPSQPQMMQQQQQMMIQQQQQPMHSMQQQNQPSPQQTMNSQSQQPSSM